MLNPSIWFNADPAATYFLDSLSIFVGNTYKFVDHPGTPLHLIGTFLLALTYPFFSNQEAFINFHLARPSVFFGLTNIFLLAVNLVCVIVFYKTVITTLNRDRLLAGIALAILYYGLHKYSFPSLTFWSHNSFNFPINTLWLLWFYNELRREQVPGTVKLLLLGLAAGMLAVTQIYFTIWLASGVFALFIFVFRQNRSFSQALRAAVLMAIGGLTGIVLMFLPVYKEFPRFIGWLTNNVTHQGLYGSGETGIYSLSMIPVSIHYWWATIRPMFLLLVITLLILGTFVAWYMRSNERLSPSSFAMLVGLLALTMMVLFVMSKVILRLRFSLSLAATLPVLILILVKLLETTPWNLDTLKRLFYIATIAGVTFSVVQQMELQRRRSFAEREAPVAKAEALSRLAREMDVTEEDVTVVYAFSVPLKCPSLLLASIWQGSFEREINTLCPNQYVVLDVAEELDADFLTARPIPKIQDIDWDLVVWPGNSSNYLPEYLYSVGATTIPDSWRIRRAKWFFIHSEILQD